MRPAFSSTFRSRTHGGPGAGKEVVQHCDLVAKEHEPVDEMGTDETSATGHYMSTDPSLSLTKDPLAL